MVVNLFERIHLLDYIGSVTLLVVLERKKNAKLQCMACSQIHFTNLEAMNFSKSVNCERSSDKMATIQRNLSEHTFRCG